MDNLTRVRSSCLLVLIVFLMVLSGNPAAQQQQSGAAQLRAAVDRETIDGDVRAAIKAYEAVAKQFAHSDRTIAARALLHLAQAQRKLGNAEAERVYRELLREYPEQADVVAAARSELATLRPTAVERVGGSVCTNCVGPYEHSFTMSPDGRWFGYTDAENNLMARNLETGEVTRLVAVPTDPAVRERFRARRAVWSRDGRNLAFFYRDVPASSPARGYLKVLSLGSNAEPRTLVDNPDFIYVNPAAWSPDGKAILVEIQRRDFTWQLAWVSAQTGAITQLRSLHWDFNEFRNGPELSPDGRYIAYATFVAAVEPPAPGRTMTRITIPEARTIHVLSADGSRDVIVARTERGWPVGEVGPLSGPSPIWNADGSAVLFVSQRDSSGVKDLWTAEVRDGAPIGTPRVLKTSLATEVQLVGTTHSGELYYVQPASQSTRIFVSGGSGESAEMLATNVGFTGWWPSWSPDGRRLAWNLRGTGTKLAVFSSDTGEVQELSEPQGWIASSPVWPADGKAIFAAMRSATTGRGVAVVKFDLAAKETSTIGTYQPREGETWPSQFAITPNGKMLVMTATAQDRRGSLMAVDLQSGNRDVMQPDLSSLFETKAGDDGNVALVFKVGWHPRPLFGVATATDGRIALIKRTDGGAVLATLSPDGKDDAVLYGPVPVRSRENAPVSPLGEPKWLTDGGVAFGVQQEDFSWKLMRVGRDGRAEPLGTAAHPLSLPADTQAFDISPDGKRVAYQRPVTFSGELSVLVLR
jgi:Tol biopolymer transport system component